MAKKVYRTPQQKKIMGNAIQAIDYLKKQGSEGRNAAVDLYHTLKNSDEYKEAREGITLNQIFKDLDDYIVKCEEGKQESGENREEELFTLFQILQDNKLELTEEQNKLLKEIILYGYSRYPHLSVFYRYYVDRSKEMRSYTDFLSDGDLLEDRNISLNLLCVNFKRFSQQDKEDILLELMKKAHCEYEISSHEDLTNKKNFGNFPIVYNIGCSKKSELLWYTPASGFNAFYPLIIETLQNSTNEKFIFEVFWYLDRYNKDDIPQNCISVYSNMEKLKKYVKFKGGSEYIWSRNTNKAFKILNRLGLTITWDVAEEWYRALNHQLITEKFYYGRGRVEERVMVIDEVNRLSEIIIQKDSVKQALNSIIENCKEGDLEKFKKYFSSEYIWGLLDDKYKKPEFVNKHIDALKPILNKDGIEILLQQIKKLTKGKKLSDSEKFHRDVFVYLSIEKLAEIRKYIDLTTLDWWDFGFKGNGLYNFVEGEGLLGTPYLDNVLKGHGYPKTHSVYYMLKAKGDVSKDFLEGVLNNKEGDYYRGYYNAILSSEEATAFMQDIYQTQDENLVKKLFDKIGGFSKYCTQEEINILIRKMIKAISSKEDFQKFYDTMKEYAYSKKFGIFLKIKYLLTGSLEDYKLRENKTEIPLDIYASFISSKIINIGNRNLPKVGPSVFVDADDLMKLSGYYNEMIKDEEKARQAEQQRNERLQREKEETEKIYSEAVKNREKGEVVFDKYKKDETYKGQKYILSVDRKKHILKFISAPIDECGYHSDLHYKYVEDGRCLGGGFLDKDDEKKVIRLWGYSQSYGSVDEKETMKKMLEKKFTGYTIIYS